MKQNPYAPCDNRPGRPEIFSRPTTGGKPDYYENNTEYNICGKMDKGDYTVAGCIEVAVDDRGIPISIGGNVKDEDIAQALREWARKLRKREFRIY